MRPTIASYHELYLHWKGNEELCDAFSTPDDAGNSVEGLFTEMSDVVRAYLYEYGFSWDELGIQLKVDASVEDRAQTVGYRFMQAEQLLEVITNAYDHSGEAWADLLWDHFDLGGDDDVDYSSSYPSAGLAIFRSYIFSDED